MSTFIAGAQRLTLQDFPGTPAAMLFTTGCNLSCGYCHNRTLMEGRGRRWTEAELATFIAQQSQRVPAIVLSGGEPTIHPGLIPLLWTLKAHFDRTKLDSNGLHPGVLTTIISSGLIDHLAIDLKVSQGRYNTVGSTLPSGPDIDYLRNITAAHHVTLEFRTTWAKPLVSMEDLKDIRAHLRPTDIWTIRPYKTPRGHSQNQYQPPSTAELKAARDLLPNEIIDPGQSPRSTVK